MSIDKLRRIDIKDYLRYNRFTLGLFALTAAIILTACATPPQPPLIPTKIENIEEVKDKGEKDNNTINIHVNQILDNTGLHTVSPEIDTHFVWAHNEQLGPLVESIDSFDDAFGVWKPEDTDVYPYYYTDSNGKDLISIRLRRSVHKQTIFGVQVNFLEDGRIACATDKQNNTKIHFFHSTTGLFPIIPPPLGQYGSPDPIVLPDWANDCPTTINTLDDRR